MTLALSGDAVSVVIQGAVDPSCFSEVLESARAVLPDCEVVLSTWEGTTLNRPEVVDKLVLSPDPGAQAATPAGVMNNTNRQIVSTLNGLRAATRPFALKLRTDCKLDSDGFLSAFGRYPKRKHNLTIFDDKIVVPRYATRVETAKLPYLFHPSDIALFGRRTDLLRLFGGRLVYEEEFNWYKTCPDSAVRERLRRRGVYYRLTPEQHIFVGALINAGMSVDLSYCHHTSPELVSLSRLLLVNNFIVIPEQDFGLVHLKKKLLNQMETDIATCYTTRQYECVYQENFDPAFPLRRFDRFVGRTVYNYYQVEGFFKHARRAIVYTGRAVTSGQALEFAHKAVAEILIFFFWLVLLSVYMPLRAIRSSRRTPQTSSDTGIVNADSGPSGEPKV